jgi:hypothetical protein
MEAGVLGCVDDRTSHGGHYLVSLDSEEVVSFVPSPMTMTDALLHARWWLMRVSAAKAPELRRAVDEVLAQIDEALAALDFSPEIHP